LQVKHGARLRFSLRGVNMRHRWPGERRKGCSHQRAVTSKGGNRVIDPLGSGVLDLRRIACFVMVADELSFTEAARRLQIGQPWLSTQVRKLEDGIGLQLFQRSTRRVVFTPAGEAFLPHARGVLEAAEQAAAAVLEMRRFQDRQLILGSPPHTLNLPLRAQAVARFKELRPDVELEIYSGETPKLIKSMLDGETDIAFVTGPFPRKGLRTTLAARASAAIRLPAEHPAAGLDTVPIAALRGHRVAVFPRAVYPGLHDEMASRYRRHGVDIVEAPEVSPEALRWIARRERIAWVHYAFLDDMPEPGWVRRPFDAGNGGAMFHLAMPESSAKPSALLFWKLTVGLAGEIAAPSATALHPLG
jgi:DNA-binding transcriptional LysR family regulator